MILSILRLCVVIAISVCGTVTQAADKPWDEILGAPQGKLPPPRDGLQTTIELPTHRNLVAKTTIKWETDLGEAMKIAQRENRPLFITFRCLPCKSCSEFDKTVLEGGDDLNPLFLQFVAVRLISTKEVDLRILNMPLYQDMDVSWWSWFLSPDGRVYSVFGGRDKSGDQTRTSKAALVKTMNRVLAHHHDPRRPQWDIDGPAPQTAGKPSTPADQPGFQNWLKQRNNAELYKQHNCIHCHQTAEIIRQGQIDLGQFDKNRDVKVWPLPENVGVVVERDDGLMVQKVINDSPAANAGLKPGDTLAAADGRRLFSQADFRGALHRTPLHGPAMVDLKWLRDGKVMSGTLNLTGDWRATDLAWRTSIVDGNVGGSPGFWPGDAGVWRQRLELPAHTMAVKPHLGFKKPSGPAYEAGLRGNDIITAVNGESPNLFARDFLLWFRMKYEPGDDVILTVKNENGKEREVTYKAGK